MRTGSIFDHDRVAVGYATARPYLHDEVRARLESELSPLFGSAPRRVAFAGYVQTLRKP